MKTHVVTYFDGDAQLIVNLPGRHEAEDLAAFLQPAPIEAKYGSFLGDEDPADLPEARRLVEMALDRLDDDLLTREQLEGALRFAAAALFAS